MPVNFSIEVFPPHDAAAQAQFDSTVMHLSAMRPSFCSVTYGAGGSARDGSSEAIRRLWDLTDFVVAAHLTCANQTKQQTNQIAQDWWAQGIRHIVALRGDLDRNAMHLEFSYRNAAELVAGLRALADFEIDSATPRSA